MLRGAILGLLLATGCASAPAQAFDPADDTHCHVLSKYFERDTLNSLKERSTTVDFGAIATIMVGEWYREKWLSSGERYNRESEAKALWETIGVNFVASKEAYVKCSNRALSDKDFKQFSLLLKKNLEKDDWWRTLSP